MAKTIKKKVPKREPHTPEIDEIQSLFSKVFEERRKAVLTALGVFAVVVLAGIGLTMLQYRRAARAADIEAEGITAFQNAGKAEQAASADAYQKALALLDRAAALKKTPATVFYQAETHLKLGEKKEAMASYESFLDDFDEAPLASAVATRLAQLYAADDRVDDAAAALEPVTDAVVGGDTALMDLAGLYDKKDRKDEAAGLLKEMVTTYPASPWAADARARVEPPTPEKDGDAAVGPSAAAATTDTAEKPAADETKR